MAEQEQGNIRQEYNNATTGLNMDQTPNQIQKGKLTYALNAAVENFDSNSVNYQNEPGNELCVTFPSGFVLIGNHFIQERNKHVFFITNPDTGASQIGYMENNDCVYRVLVNAPCLNFNTSYPIQKVAHKITNCTTEIYWTDGYNPRRYLDIDNIPKVLKSGTPFCHPEYTDDLDCNQLKLQPNFKIPQLDVTDVTSTGNLTAGTYQFAIQYSDPQGNPYTSYYSVTNPTPIADEFITSVNFNYPVGKSIILNISNLEDSGLYQYFNLAVIRTVNDITSVELVGTYYIDNVQKQITYTGQNVTQIRLTINDIFEKFPYYDIAQDLTTAQDILIWDNLTSIDRINYQSIANQINLQWESWRIPANENYADELNATNLRGYLRDEVYAFEIVFLLKNGKQTDGFHIPGRIATSFDLTPVSPANDDFIGEPDPFTGTSPYWKIYNTASVTGFAPEYSPADDYKGPYQYGQFAYWESTDTYPCNADVWGDLAGQPIRHHKFPDINISAAYESKIFLGPTAMVQGNDAVFPIGVHLDIQQVEALIQSSSLTDDQKSDIVGFKIIRADRGTNKSIVAKGILRNVNTYEREKQTYFYPNYPYNDLNVDPFLNENNNAWTQICDDYTIEISSLGPCSDGGANCAEVLYTDCNSNKQGTQKYYSTGTYHLCSTSKPLVLSPATGRTGLSTYDVWVATICPPTFLKTGNRIEWVDIYNGPSTEWITGWPNVETFTFNAVPGTIPKVIEGTPDNICFTGPTRVTGPNCKIETPQHAVTEKYRQIFNSPETSFGQPFLGGILKLESVMFGGGKAHFVEVKSNAKYKLLTEQAQVDALNSSNKLGALTTPFSATAMFTTYQAYLTIYVNGITRKNYAYSFNSVADYNYGVGVPDNLGIKQRNLDIARYLIPGVQNVGDVYNINNFQRESSVYLRTDLDRPALPFPDQSPNMVSSGSPLVTDKSRFTISEIGNCDVPGKEEDISVVSYYASMKNIFPNQYGQIYSYDTVDTGYQAIINSVDQPRTVFGGDTFISRFAFKSKLPFFIDNRVNAPDDSDIFYDEIGNIAYPKYWHSARSILKDYVSSGGTLTNIISYKAHNFDCPNDQGVIVTPSITTTTTTTILQGTIISTNPNRTYYDGYFYLFAYGIPNFYCESSYNIDLRQAFNNREGDFWPHVSTGIPDDWVQQSFVPIAQDNTYYYNVSYSKQNRENTFTHLPIDWDKPCYTYYPFRAIYSDSQNIDADNRVNSWLIYRAISYYDFPQNFGDLVSLDGIQNRAVLARFENKTLMYNNLLTIDTSNPQAAYVGNPRLFRGAPPIDFAETDLGYVGTQNKMLLKIPQGQVSVDAKRGQVFLIAGTEAVDLSGFGSGLNRFFTDHLAFEILRYFPKVNTDNNFTGIGLHGVYDSKYDRVLITKLDYVPKVNSIMYDENTRTFYDVKEVNGLIIRIPISVSDEKYFCNKSWTVSFNFNTKSWISFHSYLPNWYIGENNFFYSGINGCCDDFDVLVGTIGPIPTTTTTTTLDCALAGIIYLYDCDLEGTATRVTTTTTTSSTSTTTTSTTTTSTSSTTTTSTSSTTTTTSSTSTTTTTTTACPCYFYDVTITQEDIDSATGNGDTSLNGKVFVQYRECDNPVPLTTLTYSTAGTYTNALCQDGSQVDNIFFDVWQNNVLITPTSTFNNTQNCCNTTTTTTTTTSPTTTTTSTTTSTTTTSSTTTTTTTAALVLSSILVVDNNAYNTTSLACTSNINPGSSGTFDYIQGKVTCTLKDQYGNDFINNLGYAVDVDIDANVTGCSPGVVPFTVSIPNGSSSGYIIYNVQITDNCGDPDAFSCTQNTTTMDCITAITNSYPVYTGSNLDYCTSTTTTTTSPPL